MLPIHHLYLILHNLSGIEWRVAYACRFIKINYG